MQQTKTTLKTLSHGQAICISHKGKMIHGTFGTLIGFMSEGGFRHGALEREQAKADARVPQCCHAWANQEPACITDSREYYRQAEARRASAVEVTDGERVQDEHGRIYRVRFVRPNVSDFIHFIHE